MKYEIDVTITVKAAMTVCVGSFDELTEAAHQAARKLAFTGYGNPNHIESIDIDDVDNWSLIT